MKHPLDSKWTQTLGLFLARVPLGIYLLLDGYAKIQHGPVLFAFEHLGSFQKYFPFWVAAGFLVLLPFVELAAGAFLALGLFSRTGAFLASFILLSIMLAFTGFHGLNGAPFNPLLILLGLAVMLGFAGSGALSIDRLVWRKRR